MSLTESNHIETPKDNRLRKILFTLRHPWFSAWIHGVNNHSEHRGLTFLIGSLLIGVVFSGSVYLSNPLSGLISIIAGLAVALLFFVGFSFTFLYQIGGVAGENLKQSVIKQASLFLETTEAVERWSRQGKIRIIHAYTLQNIFQDLISIKKAEAENKILHIKKIEKELQTLGRDLIKKCLPKIHLKPTESGWDS